MRKKPTNRQILFTPPGSVFRESFPILSVTIFRKRKQPSPGCRNTLLMELKKTRQLKSSVHPYHRTCVRRNLLHSVSGVCVSAPKTSYPQSPSSFPPPIEPTSLGFDGDPVKAASRSRHSPEPDVHGRGLCWWAPGCTLRPAPPFAGRSCACSAASRRFPHTRARTAHRGAGS